MPPDVEAGTVVAIVVAAGRGTRFGSTHKVLTEIAGRPLLRFVVDSLFASRRIDRIVIVAGEHTQPAIEELLRSFTHAKPISIVRGGARRQDSVEAGLAAAPDAQFVVVHDGARPFASPALFDASVEAAHSHGAAIAAARVTDTIKRVHEQLIAATVPRDDLWAAQTPQTAMASVLRAAFDRALQEGWEVTDEASLLERAGHSVAIVESTSINMKVTRPEDIAIANAIWEAGLAGGTLE